MVDKFFVTPNQLFSDSFELGRIIYESEYKPNYIIAIWRGGTPIGIAIQEYLDFFGIETDHISIRTSSYESIGKREKTIKVHGLGYLIKKLNFEDSLLIIDDVFDTGLSIMKVLDELYKACRKNYPLYDNIKIATLYYKPYNNRTPMKPDYYLYETDRWIVFPHELKGLTTEEILKYKKLGYMFKENFKTHSNKNIK